MPAHHLVSARNEGVAEKPASVTFLQPRAERVEGLRWGTHFLVIKSRSHLINLIPRDPPGPGCGQQNVDLIPASSQIPGLWPSGESGQGAWERAPRASLERLRSVPGTKRAAACCHPQGPRALGQPLGTDTSGALLGASSVTLPHRGREGLGARPHAPSGRRRKRDPAEAVRSGVCRPTGPAHRTRARTAGPGAAAWVWWDGAQPAPPRVESTATPTGPGAGAGHVGGPL